MCGGLWPSGRFNLDSGLRPGAGAKPRIFIELDGSAERFRTSGGIATPTRDVFCVKPTDGNVTLIQVRRPSIVTLVMFDSRQGHLKT